jgi:cysteine desulfuration protein SufE
MTPSLEDKITNIKKLFHKDLSDESRYKLLMDIGKTNKQYEIKDIDKTQENLVSGCQSTTYLQANKKEGKIFFSYSSDAFISKGIASLLVQVYNGEKAEIILKNSYPTFLEDIKIAQILSPSRSNGLNNIFLTMQRKALKLLLK